jgi:hypothetical protein
MKRRTVPSAQPDFLRNFANGPMFGLLCLALIIGVHSSYIANGFLWLDHGDIEEGRAIIPLAHWFHAFVTPLAATGFYRPLITLIHSLDAAIWNLDATWYHCTNLALHIAAAFAAPAFLRCFIPLSRFEQWVVVLVFGIHPIAMLPAGYISFRSEPLFTFLLYCAIRSYCAVRAGNRPLWFAALFVFTASACFSKETAFFYIPSIIAVWEAARAVRSNGFRVGAALRGAAAAWPAALTTAAALGMVFFLRLHALPNVWRLAPVSLPPLEAVATRLSAIGKYFVNFVSPFWLSFSDATAIVTAHRMFPIALTVAVVCAALIVIYLKRGFSLQGITMALLIAIGLFPASNIVPLPRFYSPHYAYMALAPAIGAAVLIARLALRTLRPRFKQGLVVIFLAWLVTAAVSTFSAGPRFKSDETFFLPEVNKDPRFLEAWFYLGNYHLVAGEPDRAWKDYEKSLRSGADFIAFIDRPGFLINQSAAALQRSDLVAADSTMRLAQECAPENLRLDVLYNRAFIAGRRGDYDAVIDLLYPERDNFRRPEAFLMLANALQNRGRATEAEAMYKRYTDLAGAARKLLSRKQ